MRIRAQAALLSLALASSLYGANWPDHPTLTAVRVATAPVIDGDLSDAAWQQAPEFTDFTQHDPNDAAPPTMKTSVRIVYDANAIYFGAKMTDPEPPSARLARRDSYFQSDFLSINLDPQLDRLSGNAFTVTPANVQLDSVLYDDIGEDASWDGVWESATRIVPDGWIAEVRIPFSQLRFPDRPRHVWGVNITRRTLRNNEWVRIVNTPKGQTGFVSHFADIVGIEGIHRGRSLELVPYGVARSDIRTRADRANPFLDSRDGRADAGLDLKYALTSSLTLTGTINPDFGQVEVDPAVVNLSQYETFYPEKRPFFTEGLNIFAFDRTPAPSHFSFISYPQLFYTRRIGRAPQILPNADYVDVPDETTILGAAKVTGKLPGGWAIGVLDALTDSERARYVTPGGAFDRAEAEPLTNYFVSRASREIGARSRVGFIATSVERRISESDSLLRGSAATGGFDGYTGLGGGSWLLEGSFLGTNVRGSREAIAATQQAPAHYYQRPDAGNVHFDPTRTSLSGWGGRTMLSKTTGIWRPLVQVQAFSPGFETNDIGYMQRTDILSAHAIMQYVNPNPKGHFRERRLWVGGWQNRNFDGDTLERGFLVDGSTTFQNYWSANASVFATPGAFNDRKTRGGPVVRTPRDWSMDAGISSDDRKSFVAALSAGLGREGDGSYDHSVGLTLTARPSTSLSFSVEPFLSRSHEFTQYVATVGDSAAVATYGRRYVFAELEEREFEIGTRVDWTLNPRLSLQLYLQPFIASGDYHDYRALVAPRTADYAPYAYSGGNNDFNFRSVRGSAVMRWEFRPGSALYVVWNENRADIVPTGDFNFSRDLRAIPGAPSHDVFLVKVSYWLPM